MNARLEHVNFTVPDPKATAAFLCDLFDWSVRWEGTALNEGYTVHVGGDETYLALYAPPQGAAPANDRYIPTAALNHLGLVVEDLDDAEQRVIKAGYTPRSHANYEPGRRFYFDGPDGVEYELVSYDNV